MIISENNWDDVLNNFKSPMIFENYKNWGEILDKFRQSNYYKKSNGKNLRELLYWWINQEVFSRSNPFLYR
jgi:hypothetical protein